MIALPESMPTRVALALLILSVFAAGPVQADSGDELARAALARTAATVIYDGSYRRIGYPNGDVPANVGVCTDVVIRAYRTLGIDLQSRVHEDMSANFAAYPSIWGLKRPDPNIDHRRVPNLETYFARHATRLPRSKNPADYRPGDVVTWRLPNNLPHIGIVGHRKVPGSARHLIIHNIGAGPVEEDILFRYRINGHYRY